MSERKFGAVGLTLSGLAGIVIGAGSMVFAQKSADVAENQYYMSLDLRRYNVIADEGLSFEQKKESLETLRQIHRNGFKPIFVANVDADLEEVEAALTEIARAETDAAKVAIREAEAAKAAVNFQSNAVQAVRVNPLIVEACLRDPNMLCP